MFRLILVITFVSFLQACGPIQVIHYDNMTEEELYTEFQTYRTTQLCNAYTHPAITIKIEKVLEKILREREIDACVARKGYKRLPILSDLPESK